jgi:hypothetical protein
MSKTATVTSTGRATQSNRTVWILWEIYIFDGFASHDFHRDILLP